MFTPTFLTGLLGSLVLVTGAAWPETKADVHPTKSIKNWLFAVGGVLMFLYSYLGYQDGGPIFFVILEGLAVLASFMMMFDLPDKVDLTVIGSSSLALVLWSLTLFEDFGTVIFILGLCGISLGYALQTGTVRRSLALTLGSVLIAVFSYLETSWIFFWLNVFFALFSGYYVVKGMSKKA